MADVRITGYCEQCHRVRTVRVSSARMVRLAQRQVAVGICSACEDENDKKRRARR